jgi:hypothetical protein
VRISPSTTAFAGVGGEGSVDVVSPGGCSAWTAVSNDSWIDVTSGPGGTGNGTVLYTVAPNPDVMPRTGSLTIAGRTHTVEQAGGQSPAISIDDVVVTEGPDARASFTVSLSFASGSAISVQYSTANGTAAEGDFVPAPPTLLTFAPGETDKPVVIEIEDDPLDEDDESFFVELSGADAPIEDAQGAGTILDDDPLPALSIADVSFAERNGLRPVLFRVEIGAESGRTVTVSYAVVAGSATPGTEFRERTGSLTFPPGATRRWILVWTRGDRVDEADEDFFIELGGAVNATIATPRARATIVDDDPTTTP